MKKERVEIIKQKVERSGKKYILLLFPNEKENTFTDIYIQKENCGMIEFCIGLDFNQLSSSADDFIKDNIEDWIDAYNHELEILEERQF